MNTVLKITEIFFLFTGQIIGNCQKDEFYSSHENKYVNFFLLKIETFNYN